MPRRGFNGCTDLAKDAAAGGGEHSPVRPSRILRIPIIRRGGREGGKEGGREELELVELRLGIPPPPAKI
jgi:hypothetical protein